MLNKKVMYRYFNKYLLSFLAIACLPATAMAAEQTKSGGSLNLVLISLLTLIIVLLFVIGMMGSTLVSLGQAYKEKIREKKSKSGIVKMLLVSVTIGASLTATAQEAVTPEPVSITSIAGLPVVEFYMLIGTIILELFVILVLILLTNILIKAIAGKEDKYAAKPKEAKVNFWDRFNATVAIEKEKDIMLDHDYDGIKELDNSLPPWWKYGFYLTIVVGVIYLWHFHIGNGKSPEEEFIAEMKRGEEEVAAYLAKSANNVDENSVVMLDGVGIAAGQGLFAKNCIACHGPDGGGNAVGPNLADEYWLHKGSIKDIFKSIKYGWPDKGMKSWKDDFSPKQIAQLTSYVKSLQGTVPTAPKEPQGDLYIEAESSEQDSTTTEIIEEE